MSGKKVRVPWGLVRKTDLGATRLFTVKPFNAHDTESMRTKDGFSYVAVSEPDPVFVVQRLTRSTAWLVSYDTGQPYTDPMSIADAIELCRSL